MCMIMVEDSESKDGVTASKEILSQLRQLSAGVDIIRTAKIKVRKEDGLLIFGEEMSAKVSVGVLLAFHITGKSHR